MSQIREVKEATDIVEVIGSRLELKHSGSHYKGLCPFHSEKSPSFFVSEQMQRYKCFGCGETGDVFTFLEKYEGMTFYEALKELADKAGITLKEYTRSDQDVLHDKLLEVLDMAKEYYHFLLTDHEVGQPARDYLKDRGINVQVTTRDQQGAYESYIRLTVITETQERGVAGTVFANGKPRVIQVKGINMEAELTESMLYVTNEDRPGHIGRLGTLLGELGINIANFNLGRTGAGGDAIALVSIDGEVSEEQLRRIAALEGVKQAKALQF